MNIAIFGLGYVGMAYAALLSKKHKLFLVDTSKEVISKYSRKDFSHFDEATKEVLKKHFPSLTFWTFDLFEASCIDSVIISTPTNLDNNKQGLDSSSIEEVIVFLNGKTYHKPFFIKSTIPVGYTLYLRKKYNRDNIYFSPEFLRENHAFEDVSKPSRIILNEKNQDTISYVNMLIECIGYAPPILYIKSQEAEAIKLFSNTYLAMRVAFFNELDTYAEEHNLNSRSIIEGMGYDSRIGSYYNHPSFGFGGYCLPKDTMQLDFLLGGTKHPLISSINESNNVRKNSIVNAILSKRPKTIGFYRLVAKKDGSNMRESAMVDILLKFKNFEGLIYIYEPLIKLDFFEGFTVLKDLDVFKKKSDLIVANFMDKSLNDIIGKVYTRDIFFND